MKWNDATEDPIRNSKMGVCTARFVWSHELDGTMAASKVSDEVIKVSLNPCFTDSGHLGSDKDRGRISR
jgi:hypothetical protein